MIRTILKAIRGEDEDTTVVNVPIRFNIMSRTKLGVSRLDTVTGVDAANSAIVRYAKAARRRDEAVHIFSERMGN